MKILRVLFLFGAILFALAIISINYRLYNPVKIVENEEGTVNVAVVQQLHFIQTELGKVWI